MPMTGTVVGYDPGGNGNHGFARATVRDGDIVCVTTKTLQIAEDVVRSILGGEKPPGIRYRHPYPALFMNLRVKG